jgi:dihydroorotate dehydrogenase (fumarate)
VSAALTTTYLGLELATPVVPSASPLGRDLRTLRALQDAGAGAVVLPSLFAEQVEQEARDVLATLRAGAESNPEALSYFPAVQRYNAGPEPYLDHVRAVKAALSIPVVASLNGASAGTWTRYARLLEAAGADAIELNVYLVAADPADDAASVEGRILALVRELRALVSVPLAVKIGPFHTALAGFATRLVDAGADGIVLFNRFVQPDVDLDTLGVEPRVHLSSPDELLLPLRWTALLRRHVAGSLALTTGVHTATDALKAILVGADVVMCASALLRHGPGRVADIVRGVQEWLDTHGYESVAQARGSLSAANVADPGAYERAQYVQALAGYTHD